MTIDWLDLDKLVPSDVRREAAELTARAELVTEQVRDYCRAAFRVLSDIDFYVEAARDKLSEAIADSDELDMVRDAFYPMVAPITGSKGLRDALNRLSELVEQAAECRTDDPPEWARPEPVVN